MPSRSYESIKRVSHLTNVCHTFSVEESVREARATGLSRGSWAKYNRLHVFYHELHSRYALVILVAEMRAD